MALETYPRQGMFCFSSDKDTLAQHPRGMKIS